MEKLIREIIKSKSQSSIKEELEKKIENNIEKKMKTNCVKKKLKIKIPRNNTKFILNFEDDYISPKICHSIKVYSIN